MTDLEKITNLINHLEKKMIKKKATKKATKKNARTSVSITKGISQLTSTGSYYARKTVDGVRVSKCFKNLGKAKTWLKNSL